MKKLTILLLVALALSIGALGEAPLSESAKDTVAPNAEEIVPRAEAAGAPAAYSPPPAACSFTNSR